ncbi:aldolase [Choiromyces venosus 120613-1]|uniref:Aldolase n=1 Tax=Choiromyces venosus 120613-1 TaxID=1336337 RepID=A0A3N4IYS6_9PEZI|nr:aldolase [Choiromyces venosus 120613-1]
MADVSLVDVNHRASPSSHPPAGIYIPVPTFFVPAASKEYNPLTHPLGLDAQASHALHLTHSGITGLELLGSTGEAVYLTRTECVAQINHVGAALAVGGYKDYPLIAGTATNEEMVEFLNESAAAGAGWGLVLALGYFATATSEEGTIIYIPVMIPATTTLASVTTKLSPSIFRALAAHPNIVGGKFSHSDISIHAQIALDPKIDHSKFHLFTGLGQQLFLALQVGYSVAIDDLLAIFLTTVVHLYNLVMRTKAMDQETLDRVRELQYWVSCTEELIVKFGTVGIKEAVARVLSFGEPDGGRLLLARWSVEMMEMARVEMEFQTL